MYCANALFVSTRRGLWIKCHRHECESVFVLNGIRYDEATARTGTAYRDAFTVKWPGLPAASAAHLAVVQSRRAS